MIFFLSPIWFSICRCSKTGGKAHINRHICELFAFLTKEADPNKNYRSCVTFAVNKKTVYETNQCLGG